MESMAIWPLNSVIPLKEEENRAISPVVSIYGRLAVKFLDPLGRGGKPSNIFRGIYLSIYQMNPTAIQVKRWLETQLFLVFFFLLSLAASADRFALRFLDL